MRDNSRMQELPRTPLSFIQSTLKGTNTHAQNVYSPPINFKMTWQKTRFSPKQKSPSINTGITNLPVIVQTKVRSWYDRARRARGFKYRALSLRRTFSDMQTQNAVEVGMSYVRMCKVHSERIFGEKRSNGVIRSIEVCWVFGLVFNVILQELKRVITSPALRLRL